MIELRTLGTLDLRGADGQRYSQLLARPKRLGVLLYLALATPRGSHRRDALLGLFWPELDQEKARHALRQTIHHLRQSLGPDVIVGRGDGGLGIDRDLLWCDAAAFEAALDAGQPADALALFAGDLAPGFFLDQLSEFERWLEAERDRLRRRAADAAWQLADASLEARDASGAERSARRAAALTPGDEGSVRRLIALLDRTGNRVGALRVYEEFAKQLADEYGVEPAAETRALVAAVRQRNTAPPSEVPPVRSAPAAAVPATAPASTPEPVPPPATVPRPFRWRLAAAGTAGLALLAGARILRSRTADPATGTRAIAVLPFANLDADSGTSYFADGMTDDIARALAQAPGVQVTAHASAFQFRGTTPDTRDVGHRLGVSSLVEGSVRRAGDHLYVAAELVDARTGSRLWSRTFDSRTRDMFAVQDSIGRAVLQQLGVDPHVSGGALVTPPTQDLAAYDLYLLGRFYFNSRSPTGLQKAIGYFSQAIAKDSTDARAYAGLAETDAIILTYIEAPPDALRLQAKQAAERALALDQRLGEAHIALGAVHQRAFEWADAEREYRSAIQLDPNDASAHLWYSQILQNFGREQDQLREIRRAVALDPLSVVMNFTLGSAFYTWRRYDEAMRQSDRMLALDSTFAFARFGRGLLLAERGQYEPGIAEMQRGLALEKPEPVAAHIALLARAEVMAGRRPDAERLLKTLQDQSSRKFIAPTAFAIVYASLGRKDEAFAWLGQAAQVHDPQLMLFFPTPPAFDSLRSDPRFDRIKELSGIRGSEPR